MWAIRILTGKQLGKVYELINGANTIGRAPQCQIKILNKNISKEHAKIEVYEDKVIITDLNSRNGTFVNGVQVKSQRLNPGDKISMHDIFLEIIEAPVHQHTNQHVPQEQYMNSNLAYQQHNVNMPQDEQIHSHNYEQPQMSSHQQGRTVPQGLEGILHIVRNYMDDVVLPGVYALPEMMEFKWVLRLFMAAFIIFVTSLSTIPLLRILKSSIESEAQGHALTIAKAIERENREYLLNGEKSSITVASYQNKPGVQRAMVISSIDGTVIAPAKDAGTTPDISFVHSARKQASETGHFVVEQIDSDTIGALVPIKYYNSNTGKYTATAHATVIYDMGSLAVDDGRTISLFIQTLFIALCVGVIIFFFMYKLIEFPIRNLNEQLDVALRERHDSLSTNYKFPSLQKLVAKINSALSRIQSDIGNDEHEQMVYDRNPEMANIIQLIGFPAIAISSEDNNIYSVNPAFEERTGIDANNLLHGPIEKIPDQALKLSIEDLVQKAVSQPDHLSSNELEISGYNYEVAIQAVYGTKDIAYYIVVLLPVEEGGDVE